MTVDETVVRPGWVHGCPLDVGRSPGSLIVAWQHPTSRLISPVGLLEHGAGYRYRYLRRAPAVEGFLPFLASLTGIRPTWQHGCFRCSSNGS